MDLRSSKPHLIKIIKNVYLMNVTHKHFLILDLIESLIKKKFKIPKLSFLIVLVCHMCPIRKAQSLLLYSSL